MLNLSLINVGITLSVSDIGNCPQIQIKIQKTMLNLSPVNMDITLSVSDMGNKALCLWIWTL